MSQCSQNESVTQNLIFSCESFINKQLTTALNSSHSSHQLSPVVTSSHQLSQRCLSVLWIASASAGLWFAHTTTTLTTLTSPDQDTPTKWYRSPTDPKHLQMDQDARSISGNHPRSTITQTSFTKVTKSVKTQIGNTKWTVHGSSRRTGIWYL